MSPRLRLTLGVATCCAAAILAIFLIRSPAGGDGPGGGALRTIDGFYGAALPSRSPAVNFALADQAGQTIELSRYAGHVVIVTFIYTTCANSSPVIAQQLLETLDQLPHPVPALAISVDPRQDTRTNIQAFLIREQLLGRLQYLVAKRSVLAPIWRHFGIQPQLNIKSATADYTIDLVIIDKTGRPRVDYRTVASMDPSAIAADIRRLQAQPTPQRPPRRMWL